MAQSKAGWGPRFHTLIQGPSVLLSSLLRGPERGGDESKYRTRDIGMCQAWRWLSPLPHSTGQDSVTRPHLIITRGSTLAVCPGGRGKQQFLTHWIPLLPFRNESEHSLGHQEGSIEEVALALAWKDGRLLPKMGGCVCRGTEVTLIPRLFPAPTSHPQVQVSRHKGTGLILPADSGWSSVIWEE